MAFISPNATLPVLRLEISHADGVDVVDPNSLIARTIQGGLQSLRPIGGVVSDLSGAPAVIYRSCDVQLALTTDELDQLVHRDLPPAQVLELRRLAGDEVFEVHADFYDDAGRALQAAR